MAHFYEKLRDAREAKKLSLADVAAATRISIDKLAALERGQLPPMPVAYVRAFIREYALFLKLDARQVLEEYDVEVHGKHPTPPPQAPRAAAQPKPKEQPQGKQDRERKPPPEPPTSAAPAAPPEAILIPVQNVPVNIEKMRAPHTKRTDTNMTAIISVLILIITGMIFVYFFYWSEPETPHPTPQPVTQTPPIVPQYTPAVPATPAGVRQDSQGTTVALFPKDSLTLEGIPSDSVWVSLVADTAHVQRGAIAKGEKKTWRAKSHFLLTVGNSSRISFRLNGAPLPYADNSPMVKRNILITAATTKIGEGAPAQPAPPIQKKIIPAPVKNKSPQTAKPKSAPVKSAQPAKTPTPQKKTKYRGLPNIQKVQIP